jgi:hypothetical protein
MTLLPTMEPVSTGVMLTLDDGHAIHLRSLLQVEQLLKLLRDAHGLIGDQQMTAGERRDREAARLVNEINAEKNRAWPGGGFQPAFSGTSATTQQRVVKIPIDACDCTRYIPCPEHSEAS